MKQNSVIIFYINSYLSYSGQDISLYHQYNGRYDFVFFWKHFENGTGGGPCVINTSSASLSLNQR
jgi:hypothetical protein